MKTSHCAVHTCRQFFTRHSHSTTCHQLANQDAIIFLAHIPTHKYRIYHVCEEYKRRYTPLDRLPEAIAEGKQPSGVYRVYILSRRGISGLYNISPISGVGT